jgi:hypothetical protein
MANTKKRLSKTAKEALKKLNESKILAASKATIEQKSNQEFKATEPSNKPMTANKMRPNKKRG